MSVSSMADVEIIADARKNATYGESDVGKDFEDLMQPLCVGGSVGRQHCHAKV